MDVITAEAFAELSPASKTQYLRTLYTAFQSERVVGEQNSQRRGRTQGSAFLWVNLYGKDPLTKAFAAFLKKQGVRVIANYRGAKKAWFFGSQTDLGVYDGLQAATRLLSERYRIGALLEDAWD